MRYLPNAAQSKEADRFTIEEKGVSSLLLMERAAESCIKAMTEKGVDLSDPCIICGSGNNGGDGFAIARLLMKKNHPVHVVFPGSQEHATAETRVQIKRFLETGGSLHSSFERENYTAVIDAVFGVGLSREITGKYAEVIDGANRLAGTKIAVDIPSGVCASTGRILGTAFRADYTVTFQNVKLGLELYPGRSCAGEVIAADIGIDDSAMRSDAETAFAYDWSDLKKRMPKRTPDSNKGDYGKTLFISGSSGMAGAAYLNALAAYRTGAGLVQIYTAEENRTILQQLLPEAIIRTYDFYDDRELFRLLNWADVICIGSGLGTSEKSWKILRTTLVQAEKPCVIDADGLNLLAEHRKYLDDLKEGRFLFTPHLKEMSRLTGKDVREIRDDRMGTLQEFVASYPVVCALKDARTLVLERGKNPYINCSGNASMAKAGSGDVLAGIIAGLLAQGMPLYDAACLGTYIHGLAGDDARDERGSYSVLARELADHISSVLKKQEEIAG